MGGSAALGSRRQHFGIGEHNDMTNKETPAPTRDRAGEGIEMPTRIINPQKRCQILARAQFRHRDDDDTIDLKV
jgi:hypothetical protein